MEREASVVVVREYNAANDRAAAEEVERTCELGSSGKMSLHTDLLGDPASRIRHSPTYLMLVLFLLLRLVSRSLFLVSVVELRVMSGRLRWRRRVVE